MLDWLHPNDRAARKKEEEGSLLLQICSHLANGAKHFHATAINHKSVSDVVPVSGAFQQGAFQSNAFQVKSNIYISLDGEAEQCFGPQIAADVLAKKVLEYWQQRLS